MTKPFRNRLTRGTLLSVFLTSILAAPLNSQSNTPSPNSTDSKPNGTQSTPESKQPAPVGVETSAAASPEEVRQAEIEAETKKMFQLAAELRAEVAKTYKDRLSLIVIKKAEELEKLAKSLKTLMNKDVATANH